MGSRILAVLIMMAALACLLFGVLYFAGLKANIGDKYGVPGKALSIALTILTVPLFNLGRFIARRNRASQAEDGSK